MSTIHQILSIASVGAMVSIASALAADTNPSPQLGTLCQCQPVTVPANDGSFDACLLAVGDALNEALAAGDSYECLAVLTNDFQNLGFGGCAQWNPQLYNYYIDDVINKYFPHCLGRLQLFPEV